MRVPGQEYFNIALKEFNLLHKHLEHPNVVKAFDMYHNSLQEKIYLVMEYPGPGSTLEQLIEELNSGVKKGEEKKGLSESAILRVAKGVLTGLAYLRDKFVCHRDIKPSNIYVSKDL